MTNHRRDGTPHVLLFLCDQMQYQRQETIDPIAYTPHLDRLAGEGVFFTQHHSANGQCVPSRVSIQTGLYPHEAEVMIIYRFHGHTAHITADQRTIGHEFRDRGYTTAYFGKTHFGVPLETLGYDIGDEGPPPAAQDEREGPRGSAVDRHPAKMSLVDQRIMDAALGYLDTHDPEKPLFLTVSLHEPHPPFELIERWADRFAPDEMPIPESFVHDNLDGKPAFQREHADDARHGQHDEEALRAELHRYYTMISQVDDHFGQLRAVFERKGMWDDAVIAFTSDHGDMMGAHRMRLKGTLPYDEIFRIPLVLRLPAGSPPPTRRVVDDLSVNVSLAGTLLEAAGAPVPASFHGGSILPTIWREQRPETEEICFEHYGAYWGLHPFRAIKVRSEAHGYWKYVKYFGPDEGEAELYDLQSDPFELQNLAGSPTLAAWRAELAERVDAWWKDTGGRDFGYYESPEFKLSGAATLVDRSRP